MFEVHVSIILFMICLLPAISHQYTIAVQGKLDIGDQISNFLKDMYSRLLSTQDPAEKLDQVNGLTASTMRQMSKKKAMIHIFGSHVGKREGENPVNNINVK